ncbi:hypothetical protein [Desertibaculum subflavum]|uniref:hypothetical protein n=1 Tax=Desertibaculum subflavum TaxID=2268458 RepID=UPI000E660D13
MTGTHGYQLYFTDHGARLVGHQRFRAESDLQALRLAGAVFHACHDECEAAELWRNGERVVRLNGVDGDRPFWVTGSAADVAAEVEEGLANSRWSIARSRRLLATLAKRSG